VLRLGDCRTPFISAISGFPRQQCDHDCGRNKGFAVLLCCRFDRWPALAKPLLEYGREAEAPVSLLRHQEFKQPVSRCKPCGGALPLPSSLGWLGPLCGKVVPHL